MKRAAVVAVNLFTYNPFNCSMSLNPFTLFNVPLSFIIEEDLLEKRYLDLQRIHHPDTKSADSTVDVADVNLAYNILKDPVLRGRAILEALNINISEESEKAFSAQTMEKLFDLHEKSEEISTKEDKDKLLKHLNTALIAYKNAFEKSIHSLKEEVLLRQYFEICFYIKTLKRVEEKEVS